MPNVNIELEPDEKQVVLDALYATFEGIIKNGRSEYTQDCDITAIKSVAKKLGQVFDSKLNGTATVPYREDIEK